MTPGSAASAISERTRPSEKRRALERGPAVQLEGVPVQADDLKSLALYNYGHFTSMRVEEGRVRGLSMHLARLIGDSEQLFGRPIDPERVRDLVRQAIKGQAGPVTARVTVFAPDFEMGQPARKTEPKILVTQRPAPPHANQSPWRIKACCYERDLPLVKHVGLFGQLHQRRTAQLDGYDDALYFDANSMISEGSTWNIAFIKSDQVIWPESACLPGVTMRLIQESMNRSGIASRTAPIVISAIADMDVAFATNAATGVRAISLIDNCEFEANAELLMRISAGYWATPGEIL
jgi:branched-subunit amino acid aminotransferase/4-amino-4-deoxychorismate lyase